MSCGSSWNRYCRRIGRAQRAGDHEYLTGECLPGLSIGCVLDASGRRFQLALGLAQRVTLVFKNGNERDYSLASGKNCSRCMTTTRALIGSGAHSTVRSSRRQKGDDTGRNPTDRGKLGVKRHVMTDGNGIPVAVTISGANVHDKRCCIETVDAAALRKSRGPRRPKHLCLDKAYDSADLERDIRARRISPHIRRRGEPALLGPAQGKPRRWVVERTNSWHNRFRCLLIRWERKGRNYLALVHLACGLISFAQAH